jgi:hypothetical protein
MVGVRERPLRFPINKVAEYRRAKWHFSRGTPVGVIAERLGVSPVTVRYWRGLTDHDHIYRELRRRVLLLPEKQRDQLVTDLIDARNNRRRSARPAL